MKRILITGGLGFLGSHSIEKYKEEGYDITIIDNLSSNTIAPDDEICNGDTGASVPIPTQPCAIFIVVVPLFTKTKSPASASPAQEPLVMDVQNSKDMVR